MATSSKAAVFYETGTPLRIEDIKLPDRIEKGAALCRVMYATICGSDLHTVRGRRTEPAPLILGHEICGEIVETGGDLYDMNGDLLKAGDRITWTIMASCGTCFYCKRGMEHKCLSLKKYGHNCIHDATGLSGGFAEYIYLYPGTFIVKLPDTISSSVAAPINCALATAVHCVRQSVYEGCRTALVFGAGLLGLNCTAYLRDLGMNKIVVVDNNADRLRMARLFGADHTLDVSDQDRENQISMLRDISDGHGFDTVIEVSGSLDALLMGFDSVRTGGTILTAGLVTPGNEFQIDPNALIRKCLTFRGTHNYPPDALKIGVEFLERTLDKYPFDEIVGTTFSLEEINRAIDVTETGEFLRVGIQ